MFGNTFPTIIVNGGLDTEESIPFEKFCEKVNVKREVFQKTIAETFVDAIGSLCEENAIEKTCENIREQAQKEIHNMVLSNMNPYPEFVPSADIYLGSVPFSAKNQLDTYQVYLVRTLCPSKRHVAPYFLRIEIPTSVCFPENRDIVYASAFSNPYLTFNEVGEALHTEVRRKNARTKELEDAIALMEKIRTDILAL